MLKKQNENTVSIRKIILNSVTGMLLGVIFTISAILVFALIVKQFNPSDTLVSVVNQVIKILGIAISVFFGIKRLETQKWIGGGLSGLFFVISGFLLFSAIEGRLGNLMQLLSDSLLGILVGIIFAIIFGQILFSKKK